MDDLGHQKSSPATLYVVATPIGNLKDISIRALDVLRKVSYIAAEDTRHTRKLLTAFDLESHLISRHYDGFLVPRGGRIKGRRTR